MITRLMTLARLLPAAALAAMLPVLFAPAAAAQPTQNTPNAMQGFSKNQGQPIKIESLSLEVRDKDKVATFIDNVKLVQGDTTLECKRLIVYYDEEGAPATGKKGKPTVAKSSLPGADPAGGQQIRKLEAKGGVVMTSKDQVATGDNGTYDMKSNTIIMTGNVTLTQGPNVVRGQRLVVDMGTGISRVEAAPGQGGRVDALFLPQSRDSVKPGETPNGDAGKNTGRATGGGSDKDKPKPGAAKPMKLN
jgi:lipopolysaccharide export system protein LptA